MGGLETRSIWIVSLCLRGALCGANGGEARALVSSRSSSSADGRVTRAIASPNAPLSEPWPARPSAERQSPFFELSIQREISGLPLQLARRPGGPSLPET